MNVNDVKEVPQVENKLAAIFEKQAQLAEKYHEIEGMPWPFPLHHDLAESQVWFKDFLWRVTEELAESYEAYLDGDHVHAVEELADALHFLVELLQMVGISQDELYIVSKSLLKPEFATKEGLVNDLEFYQEFQFGEPPFTDLTTLETYWRTTFQLGLAGNCLKNKKWKQAQVHTDLVKFKQRLAASFICLMSCFKAHEIDGEGIYNMYFKKSEVNKFRQRTKY